MFDCFEIPNNAYMMYEIVKVVLLHAAVDAGASDLATACSYVSDSAKACFHLKGHQATDAAAVKVSFWSVLVSTREAKRVILLLVPALLSAQCRTGN